MNIMEVENIDALSFGEHADLFRQLQEKIEKSPEAAASMLPDFCKLLEGRGTSLDMLPLAADVFVSITKNFSKPQIKECIDKIYDDGYALLIDRKALEICMQNPACCDIIFDQMEKKVSKIHYSDDLKSFFDPFVKNMSNIIICADDRDVPAMLNKIDSLKPELQELFFSHFGRMYKQKPSIRDVMWEKVAKYKPKKPADFAKLYQNLGTIALADENKALECLNVISANIRNIRQDISALNTAYEVLRAIREDYPNEKEVDAVIMKGLRHRANNSTSKRIACRIMGKDEEFDSSSYVGQRVRKTQSNPYGFISAEEIDTKNSAILFLGGNGTISEQRANGYLSSVETLLRQHNMNDNVDLYAAIYDFGETDDQIKSFDDKLARRKMMQDYHHDIKVKEKLNKDTLDPFYVENLFNIMFLNRISDENGKRLSADEACKKVRKVTVVAHCHGAYTFMKLEEKMQQKMRELGYSAQERKKIQHELLCIAHAPFAPLGASKSTMISFVSAEDKSIKHYNNFEKEIRAMSKKGEVTMSYFPGKKGEVFLTPSMGKVTQHDFLGYNIKRDDLSKEGKAILSLSGAAIVNGVKNSLAGEPLPSVKDIVCGENEKVKKMFDIMQARGEDMWKKISLNSAISAKNKGQKDI